MAERYRFTLPDGRTHESDAGIAAILKAHPHARITHHVLLDEKKQFVMSKPYTGKQAEPVIAPVAVMEEAPAPAKTASKTTRKAD